MNRSSRPLLLVLLLLASVVCAAGERYALVIGNGRYQHLTPLENPPRDAQEVASKLYGLGFKLVDTQGRVMATPTPLLDLDTTQFTYAVQAFAERVHGAEIAFIFYAGHGMQIDGRSQLLPVDTPLPDVRRDKRLSMLRRHAQSLDMVLMDLDGQADLTIAVFDACREIPNLEQELRSLSRSTGTSEQGYRGLGRVNRAGRSRIVAYSGGFGQLVADGSGARHSPYTNLLLRHLDDAPAPVEQVFLTIAHDFGQTYGGQDPEVLIQGVEPGHFFLAGVGGDGKTPQPIQTRPDPPRPAAAVPPVNLELAYWQSADRCGTAECLRDYLKKYPSGEFSSLARARLQGLSPPRETREAQPAPTTFYARTRRLNPRGDNYLSIRSGPGSSYRELGRIHGNGSQVVVLQRSGKWLEVQYQGITGWAYGQFLTEPSSR